MTQKPKITTGPNDRPLDETIGQTGEGLPDDSSRPVDVQEESVRRVGEQWLNNAADAARKEQEAGTPEAVPRGTVGAGENVCRRCGGIGKVDGNICPDCGGSGKVTTPIGGG